MIYNFKKFFKKTNKTKSRSLPSEYAFEMININKSFQNGKIKANENINLKVKKNEIHAIVGENGAGKTTLMSMLFGLFKPDSGEIIVNGKPANFKSAIDASKAGIGMVHQHFKLVEVYSLLDNIILGAEPTNAFGFINKKKARKQIENIALQYNLKINLDAKVFNTSVGEQQRTEILKLLYHKSKVLIFDEPTAVLSDDEIKGFLDMLLQFKKRGKTIVIITHKLNEVKAVADRVSVIRKGKYIGTYDTKDTSIEKLSEYMVGNHFVQTQNKHSKNFNKVPLCLSIRNLTVCKASQPRLEAIKDLSLNIRAGEILGVAGIEGNGQTELVLAISGLMKPKSGEIIFFDNKKKQKADLTNMSVKSINDLGISHVPEDRLKYGLIPNETIAYNTVSSIIDQAPFSRFGFINQRAINKYVRQVCNTWDVRGSQNIKSKVKNLSGGNQQKLVIGREMTKPHSLIVMVQPTRGLDLKAISDIHKRILEDTKKGSAVLLISYELDEIFKIADRVVVFDEGKITYESLIKDTSQENVGRYLSRSIMKGGK